MARKRASTSTDTLDDDEPPPDIEDHHAAEWNHHSDNVHGQDDPADEDRDVRANAVRVRAEQIRLERDARALVDAEALPPVTYPPVTPLTALLDEPDGRPPTASPGRPQAGATSSWPAQYKSGKTTLGGNLIRSLIDGDEFLGRFTVEQPAERLVLIDDESSEAGSGAGCATRISATPRGVADLITLRGRVSTFNILDEKCRDQWGQQVARSWRRLSGPGLPAARPRCARAR